VSISFAARYPLRVKRAVWVASAALAAAGCIEEPPARPELAQPPPCMPCATVIAFQNDIGRSFRLSEVAMAIDDLPPWGRTDPQVDDDRRFELDVPDLGTGRHRAILNCNLRGRGYGVFAYLQGYTFRVRSSHEFAARPKLTLTAHLYEKGGPTTPLEERPAVRWVESY
jgi:hypothetical protein